MTDDLPVRFHFSVPDGDSLERRVCGHCGFVDYQNPKIVVGSVVRHEGKILMCRRAIEPRSGFWTVPAGYMELGETPQAGAAREALEEACAAIRIESLLAVYSVPRISQVQLIYRATLDDPAIAAGPESAEVALYGWDEIPYDEIAFPTVHWMLAAERAIQNGEGGAPFSNPPGESANLRR
ncbi:NUDIX hydrolase [Zhengella mangrovi]|uniref:NUDIX hydrolase n=1 Tax=Zhengella mangrovi TaxID=1982044 RepID=A0A2G1QSP0_9HYPH|nr:NUDIX hydrolase [Zhengella mangrovi]PHP68557.1 NUDIX hydrolase [Zhengella mangrovi]